jgi:hypothetical protein
MLAPVYSAEYIGFRDINEAFPVQKKSKLDLCGAQLEDQVGFLRLRRRWKT